MSKKLISIVLIVGGCALIIISLGADLLNIGGDPNAFGWKQITGSGVGLIILSVGVWLQRKNAVK